MNHVHTTPVQLAQKLEKERSLKLSPDRLRRILKKKGLFGNEPEKVIKENKKLQYAKSNSSDLDMLEWAAAAGEIDLKYLDESGF